MFYFPFCFSASLVAGFMGESSKFPKSKLAVYQLNIHNFKFKWSNVFRQTDNKSEKLL